VAPTRDWDGSSANTGPKGVIKDWQRYKQLETEKREEAEIEKMALAKKLALTCRTSNDDDKAKQKEEMVDKELEELLDDGFLQDYMQRRMQEMMEKTQNTTKTFGKVIELNTGESFLDSVDREDSKVTVIVLVHEPSVTGCQAMAGCLECLAADYVNIKWCKILSTATDFSTHLSKLFKSTGVPALLVYRAGQLLASFVRLTDQLGEDFFATDVESFLIEHGLIQSKDDIPKIIRGPALGTNESDED